MHTVPGQIESKSDFPYGFTLAGVVLLLLAPAAWVVTSLLLQAGNYFLCTAVYRHSHCVVLTDLISAISYWLMLGMIAAGLISMVIAKLKREEFWFLPLLAAPLTLVALLVIQITIVRYL